MNAVCGEYKSDTEQINEEKLQQARTSVLTVHLFTIKTSFLNNL